MKKRHSPKKGWHSMEENCSEVIRKIFHVFRDNNIVIYGTGIAAQKVVAALNDFKIRLFKGDGG